MMWAGFFMIATVASFAVCVASVACCVGWSFGVCSFVEAGAARPVGGIHRLLARRLDLAEQHRVRARADVDALAFYANHAGRQAVCGVFEGDRS